MADSVADLYGGQDPRKIPMYTVAEAAFCLHNMPQSTLRSWVFGQDNFVPVIDADDKDRKQLSFTNLIEAHVLSAMRRGYRLNMHEIRAAIKYVSQKMSVARPLAHARFMTDGASLFVHHFEALVHASGTATQTMLEQIDLYLNRVEWDAHELAIRLFPFPRRFDLRHAIKERVSAPRRVVIDPLIQFGEPVLAGTRVPTSVVADRFFADEPMEAIAKDYGIALALVEAAIRWERPNLKAA